MTMKFVACFVVMFAVVHMFEPPRMKAERKIQHAVHSVKIIGEISQQSHQPSDTACSIQDSLDLEGL